jgi:hypothetical protein
MRALKKFLEAFVTIVVGGYDIGPTLLSKMKVFIRKECVARFCALERGGIHSHFHMQVVVKLHILSLKMLNKVVKE